MGGNISEETPAQAFRVRSILFFVVRFLVLMILGLFIWWQVMEVYVFAAGWTAQWPLRGLGEPIEKVELYGKAQQQGEGDPHIGIRYTMKTGQRPLLLDLQRFYMSLPTYLALVLATWPLAWRRRVFALLVGAAIMVFVHVVYLVVMFYLRGVIMAYAEEAVRIQMTIFTALPFLLWALFAYGDRIREMVRNSGSQA